MPTERPTLPERRTKCAVSSGSVAPIRTVGTSTSRKVIQPVCRAPAPRVMAPTAWKSSSEKNPNTPMPISTSAKSTSSGVRCERESHPPSRLPRPRPNMNALTTTVTDSMSIP